MNRLLLDLVTAACVAAVVAIPTALLLVGLYR